MSNGARQDTVTIPRKEILRKGGLMILPLKEYQRLRERAIPTYYLVGREAEKLDKLVEKGLQEYRAGKTRKIKSLADLD